MLSYSGLTLDHNYGIVKTETLFGFGPGDAHLIRFNGSEPLQWLVRENMESDEESPRALKTKSKTTKRRKEIKQTRKKSLKPEGKKKCVHKILKKKKKKGRKNRRRKHIFKMHKKYVMPVLLGVIAAKSILVPVALKALAFISAKGLMMGFFSTVMASLLSLKGLFVSSHGYRRRDDAKTQVEIIQVPSTEDHVYHDSHYHSNEVQRHDFVPVNLS